MRQSESAIISWEFLIFFYQAQRLQKFVNLDLLAVKVTVGIEPVKVLHDYLSSRPAAVLSDS